MTVKKLELLLDCDETQHTDNQQLINLITKLVESITGIKVIIGSLEDSHGEIKRNDQ